MSLLYVSVCVHVCGGGGGGQEGGGRGRRGVCALTRIVRMYIIVCVCVCVSLYVYMRV